MDGPITWCFKNRAKTMVTIDWEVHIGDGVMIRNVPEKDHFTPMQMGIARMLGNIKSVRANINRYNVRLRMLSKKSRTTVSRQTMFKLAQTGLCFAASVIQLVVIMKLFESRKSISNRTPIQKRLVSFWWLP